MEEEAPPTYKLVPTRTEEVEHIEELLMSVDMMLAWLRHAYTLQRRAPQALSSSYHEHRHQQSDDESIYEESSESGNSSAYIDHDAVAERIGRLCDLIMGPMVLEELFRFDNQIEFE